MKQKKIKKKTSKPANSKQLYVQKKRKKKHLTINDNENL